MAASVMKLFEPHPEAGRRFSFGLLIGYVLALSLAIR
jgi:hypothetical protein